MSQHSSYAEPDDDDAAPPAIGEVIVDKYRVDSLLGIGGMGRVFAATHMGLGQKVAIKVLTVREDDSRREEARERFLREGRATAALVSDHVVRVYDVGTLESGAPFMVMELLRGQDLAQTVQQGGPLPVELAADCVRQAAEAIACAHEQGIVHRDLKPSNLFFTRRSDGAALVKVLDFGISKAMHNELEPESGSLTATRSLLGTPFYMSPEQVRDAKKVDYRTDIWSLGLILHELLSGSPAFEGATLPGVCAAIAADPPAALRLKRPQVSIELEQIVLKCLEKDASRRFRSARELAAALAPFGGRTEGDAFPPRSDALTVSTRGRSSIEPLHESPTLALSKGNAGTIENAGTIVSAVLTQSGERTIDKHKASASAGAALPPRGRRGPSARLIAGILAVLGLVGLGFAIGARRDAPAPSPRAASAPSPSSQTAGEPVSVAPVSPEAAPVRPEPEPSAPASAKPVTKAGPSKPKKAPSPRPSRESPPPQSDIFMQR